MWALLSRPTDSQQALRVDLGLGKDTAHCDSPSHVYQEQVGGRIRLRQVSVNLVEAERRVGSWWLPQNLLEAAWRQAPRSVSTEGLQQAAKCGP